MHYFSVLFGKELYMFRTDLLSIIRSPNTLFTTMGIYHTNYAACLLAMWGWKTGNITSMRNNCSCEYRIRTPDDGQ